MDGPTGGRADIILQSANSGYSQLIAENISVDAGEYTSPPLQLFNVPIGKYEIVVEPTTDSPVTWETDGYDAPELTFSVVA